MIHQNQVHGQQLQQRIHERQQREQMELLSLQSELRQKNSKLKTLQAKYDHLENNFKHILENHKIIIGQLETYKQEIELEKSKNIAIDNQLQIARIENAKIVDAKLKNEELKKEIELLRNVNEKLQDAFADDFKKLHSKQIKKYEDHISQLEDEIRKWVESGKKQMAETQQLKSKVQMNKKRIQDLEVNDADLRNELAAKTDRISKLMKKMEILELYQKQTSRLQASNDQAIIAQSELKKKNRGVQTIEIYYPETPTLSQTLSLSVEKLTSTGQGSITRQLKTPLTPKTPKSPSFETYRTTNEALIPNIDEKGTS